MDKQKALDRLNFMRVWYEDSGTPDADYDAICYAIGVIEEAPEGLDNLIKALEQEHNKLLELQKAQPEIIRCKDCQHSEYDAMYGDRYCHHNGKAEIVPDNHYCGYAERRTDG